MLCFDRVKCGWQIMFNSPERMGQNQRARKRKIWKNIQDLFIKPEEEDSRGRKREEWGA